MPFVDVIVIGVIVIALLVGMVLGFVRVVSGIGGWIGAGLAALYGFQYFRPVARQFITDTLIADAAAAIVLFVITLILLSLISHAISRRVRESGLRPVDRSIGLVAGLLIGVIIVSAGYLVLDQATEGENRPDWLDTAKTAPLVRRTAYFLWSFAPTEWQAKAETQRSKTSAERAKDAQRTMRDLINPVPKNDRPAEKDGYNDKEREEMDRLIRGQN